MATLRFATLIVSRLEDVFDGRLSPLRTNLPRPSSGQISQAIALPGIFCESNARQEGGQQQTVVELLVCTATVVLREICWIDHHEYY